MRILYLTGTGDGLGLAFKLHNDNNQVKVFLYDTDSNAGNGILDMVTSWRPHIEESQLVIVASSLFDVYEPVFKQKGIKYIGIHEKINKVLKGNMESFLEGCGIGHSINIIHKVKYVCPFNGRKFILPFFKLTEKNRLCAGDLGPEVQSMGVTMQAIRDELPGTEHIEMMLGKVGNPGFVELVYGTNESGEVMRPYSVKYTHGRLVTGGMVELYKMGITDLMQELAHGILKGPLDIRDDYCIVGRYCMGTFPYSVGLPRVVGGITKHNIEHILPANLLYDGDADRYVATGNTPLFVTARGSSVRECGRRMLRTFENLEMEDGFYRIDLHK